MQVSVCVSPLVGMSTGWELRANERERKTFTKGESNLPHPESNTVTQKQTAKLRSELLNPKPVCVCVCVCVCLCCGGNVDKIVAP